MLHCVDDSNSTLDKTDKIYKLRPILNNILNKFRVYYVPECELSLDEGVIPTKNKLSFKQYINDKNPSDGESRHSYFVKVRQDI